MDDMVLVGEFFLDVGNISHWCSIILVLNRRHGFRWRVYKYRDKSHGIIRTGDMVDNTVWKCFLTHTHTCIESHHKFLTTNPSKKRTSKIQLIANGNTCTTHKGRHILSFLVNNITSSYKFHNRNMSTS